LQENGGNGRLNEPGKKMLKTKNDILRGEAKKTITVNLKQQENKMNRILLIGNGFDLAHGLPTRYSDFIDDIVNSTAKFETVNNTRVYVKNRNSEYNKNGLFKPRITQEGDDKWIGVQLNREKFEGELTTNPNSNSIYFKSLIAQKENLGYWSDLEEHYFSLIYKYRGNDKAIQTINEEFEHLKSLLTVYLQEKVEKKESEIIKNTPNLPFLSILQFGRGINEFNFEKTYFITFNFTSKLLYQYFVRLDNRTGRKGAYPIPPIHIHGAIGDPNNPIIFGYGDENSTEYKALEKLKNNNLLKNFKTFQYLRSNRYRQVLGLLEENEEIYVQIIGHSCGLCDKALLKKIFEHKNVKHIETVYYADESKYFDKLYNISRIFDDNTLMREKIIPLEQTIKVE